MSKKYITVKNLVSNQLRGVMVKISFNRSSPYDPVFNPVKWNDAAISYHQPIVVLMNASKVLEGSENKKEVNYDLLFNMAPRVGLEPTTP